MILHSFIKFALLCFHLGCKHLFLTIRYTGSALHLICAQLSCAQAVFKISDLLVLLQPVPVPEATEFIASSLFSALRICSQLCLL